jgi:hypothetical protein
VEHQDSGSAGSSGGGTSGPRKYRTSDQEVQDLVEVQEHLTSRNIRI